MLYFDILYRQCLDFSSPNSVLSEDLPKSVCSVKRNIYSQMFSLYLLTHFSQLQMSLLDLQVFVLSGFSRKKITVKSKMIN